MQKLIRMAKLSGAYDQGVYEVKGNPVYLETAPIVVYNKQGAVAAANQSAMSSAASQAAANAASEVVEYYQVKCDRGMSWDLALTTLANDRQLYEDNEAALSKLMVNRKHRSEKGYKREVTVFGFYTTRNAFQGKHNVMLITEKPTLFQVRYHSVFLNPCIFQYIVSSANLLRPF